MGSLKFFLLWRFFFVILPSLEYPGYDEQDELGSESGSVGMFGTVLGGLLHVIVFPVGTTLPVGDFHTVVMEGPLFHRYILVCAV